MKYVVDRIEEGKAVLEEISTKEKKIVDVREIPTIMEGDILYYSDETYIIDAKEKDGQFNLWHSLHTSSPSSP